MSDVEVPAVRPSAEVVADWFDRHADDLGAYAARRVGATLARDVVADTFRFALERFDDYDAHRGGERAWLFGIATNLIRRHWRTEERRLRIQARAAGIDTPALDPLLQVEERLDARTRYDLVIDAIAALDPDDRDLVVLIAWEQMTSREAADVLGVRPGTVRSRLSRIRTHLSQIVREGAPHG
jgi:RNA polymerase sigma factor (sigma-70 family)